MPRKDRIAAERTPVSFRLRADLWERFVEFASWRVPRASNTELVEIAIEEMLDREERKKGKNSAGGNKSSS